MGWGRAGSFVLAGLVAASCATDRTCADQAGEALAACCADLSERACHATEGCLSMNAWTKEQACEEDWSETLPTFVACGPSDCSMMTVWARDTAHPADSRRFSSGCLPTGWEFLAADPDPCVCALATEAGPSTHVIAAMRVCESPMLCGKVNGCSPFGARAAYLYADGRLVSRAPSSNAWLVRTLSADELCGVADGVALEKLAQQSGVSISDWTDLPDTEVFVEVGGVAREARVYGDPFDAEMVNDTAWTTAPDVVTLARQLDALAGGDAYVADTVEVHVSLADAGVESQVCTLAGAPAWPFAEVDLTAARNSGWGGVVVTLTGKSAQDVRAWIHELISASKCNFVKSGEDVYEIDAEDAPPGGRDALPFESCTGI